MLTDDAEYAVVFEKARLFVAGFSAQICIDDTHKEFIYADGKEYICVPLSFPAKGNMMLFDKLMASGFCSRMDGQIIDGRRILKLLLWIEPDTYEYHVVPKIYRR